MFIVKIIHRTDSWPKQSSLLNKLCPRQVYINIDTIFSNVDLLVVLYFINNTYIME